MADGIDLQIDAGQVEARLKEIGDVTFLEPVLMKLGLRVETQIKANASGRPGPRVVTGNYRRSWNTRAVRDGDKFTVVVGTNAPQGRRLEFGFSGVDSRGRRYNQPPFPHVEPAIRQMEPEIVATINSEINKRFSA